MNQREVKRLILRRLSTLLDTDLGCDWPYEPGMTDADVDRFARARDELAQEFYNRGSQGRSTDEAPAPEEKP